MQRSFAQVRGAPESVLGPENREAWEPGSQMGRLGASHGASGAPGSQPRRQHSSQNLASLGIPGAPSASLGRETQLQQLLAGFWGAALTPTLGEPDFGRF